MFRVNVSFLGNGRHVITKITSGVLGFFWGGGGLVKISRNIISFELLFKIINWMRNYSTTSKYFIND